MKSLRLAIALVIVAGTVLAGSSLWPSWFIGPGPVLLAGTATTTTTTTTTTSGHVATNNVVTGNGDIAGVSPNGTYTNIAPANGYPAYRRDIVSPAQSLIVWYHSGAELTYTLDLSGLGQMFTATTNRNEASGTYIPVGVGPTGNPVFTVTVVTNYY